MGRLQATVRSKLSMPFSLPRPLPMPRRPRCASVVLVCALLLGYFIWFDSYTRTRPPLSLIPSPPTHEIPSLSSPKTPLSPPPPPTNPTARILLVSALFPLQQSKHSMEDYRTWLTHFLGPTGVHSDVYFYTTPALAPLLLSLHTQAQRTHTQRLTINTTYTTPWDVPPITPHRAKYERMHAWDRERGRHSPELYAVWNAKPWLLEQALAVSSQHTRGGEGYDYAFWTDAGSFREEHAYRAWPDPVRVEEVFRAGKEGGGNLEGDPVFFPLFTLPGRKEYGWRVERGPVDMDFSEGSFFGSTPSGIAWYARAFYALHDHYISTTPPTPFTSSSSSHHHPHAPIPDSEEAPPFHFVGKDQTLINALMFQHPSRFIGVLAPMRTALLPPFVSPSSSNEAYALTFAATLARIHTSLRIGATRLLGLTCGSDWYYYQWWLASAEERRKTEEVRGRWWFGWFSQIGVGEGAEAGKGEMDGWGRGLGRCEEAGVLRVDGVLRGLFGGRWVEERVREAEGMGG